MSLSRDEILAVFRETGALLEGHFILTSGLHSGTYFQCAQIFQYPEYSEKLCRDIVRHFQDVEIDLVVSPAVGGIIFGYELARQLGVRNIFTEREEGKMLLRRGFKVNPGDKVLVAEDVTTTGGSVRELMDSIEAGGGDILAVTSIVDRSGGEARFGVPYYSLFQMDVKNYKPDDCPLCRQGSQAVKPGSRKLK
ncbi:MAG: orotate phosphoribosyltransferase [Candidatus Aminicenantaceae bacterium]